MPVPSTDLELYQSLIKITGLKEGLRILDRWTRGSIGRYCRSLQQAQRLFPSLTATEIALLPLLERVPETLLRCGTGFLHPTPSEKFPPHGVPQLLSMQRKGVVFGSDSTPLPDHGKPGESPTSTELVPYTEKALEEITRILKQLKSEAGGPAIDNSLEQLQDQIFNNVQRESFFSVIDGTATLQEKQSVISFLEATTLDVFKQHGIAFHIGGAVSIAPLVHSTTQQARHANRKFGLEESTQIANLLDILGAGLLTNISVIQKRQLSPGQGSSPYGQLADVKYSTTTRAITIYEPTDKPYSACGKAGKAERNFLFAMACGESFWERLPNTIKSRWRTFHRAPKQVSNEIERKMQAAATSAEVIALAEEALHVQPGPHLENCLSEHGMVGPKEKFSSSFAFFILANEDFQNAASQNPVVRDMYRSLETLIEHLCGRKRNFLSISSPIEALLGIYDQDSQSTADTLTPVLEVIVRELFPKFSDNPGLDHFLSEVVDVATQNTGEPFDVLYSVIDEFPELEDESEDPLTDLWEALVDNGLIAENW
jgi:hypothetical protein